MRVDGAIGYRSVLVWVGCPELAERACELAAVTARPGSVVTLGVPAGDGTVPSLHPLTRTLVERYADVRVVALPDRRAETLARRVRKHGHDLVIHVDRERPTTVGGRALERICACPVWTVRGPVEPCPDQPTEDAA